MDTISYRRVSREGREAERMGAEMQERAIGDYCSYRKWSVEHLPADVNTSGKIPLAKRTSGAELLRRVANGTKRIVIFKLDRLGRNVADISQQIEHFMSIGVHLVSVSEGFDLATPMGRAMAHLLAVFAEFERSMGSERMAAMHKALRDMGRKQSRNPNYGWDEGDGKILIRNEAEQAHLRYMRGLRTRGWSDRQIAAKLNEMSIPSKTGRQWSHSAVKKILDRPALKHSDHEPPTPTTEVQ